MFTDVGYKSEGCTFSGGAAAVLLLGGHFVEPTDLNPLVLRSFFPTLLRASSGFLLGAEISKGVFEQLLFQTL